MNIFERLCPLILPKKVSKIILVTYFGKIFKTDVSFPYGSLWLFLFCLGWSKNCYFCGTIIVF